MKTSRTCQRCGTVVPATAPQSLCPRCLFDSAVDSDAPPSSADSPVGSTTSRPAGTMGATFGDYELLGELGRGGQGVVYRARHRGLGRVVALKTIPPAHLAGASAVERFRLEASAASRLDHPNIVPVYEAGERDGFCFYTMKLVEGATIQQLVSAGPPDVSACRHAATVLIKVAEAVHHAHQRGVLHRDLKPSNILLDHEHEPHVSDFGLARYEDEDASLTLSHAMIGTPAYLAPEVVSGGSRQTSVATDIYGLGAILYQLLTGRPPFGGATIAETLRSLQEDAPARPGALNPAVSADLETICLKCLRKEPSRRYDTAQELADDLKHFLEGEPILARPVGPPARLWLWCCRKPLVASLFLALNLAFGLGLAGVLWQWRRALAGELSARQHQYVSDMNRVQQSWDEGNLKGAQFLLQAHMPKPGEPDSRGFEWRYLWKLCQDQSTNSFTNFTDEVLSVAFCSDGKLLAAASGQAVKLLDVTTGRDLGGLLDPDGQRGPVAFSPVDGEVLATAFGDGIKLWNLKTKQVLAKFSGGNVKPATLAFSPVETASLAFSPDGRLLASAGWDNTLQLWSIEERRQVWTRKTPTPATTVIFTDDGKVLVSGGGARCNALRWDVATGDELVPFPPEHSGDINGTALAAGGRMLVTCSEDSSLILWDVPTHRPLAKLVGHRGPVLAAAFSPDGRLIASAGSDNTVRVWDVSSRSQISMLRGHVAAVRSVTFAANSNCLVSASRDHTVRVWDLTQRRQENILKGPHDWLGSVSFSPDGNLLAIVDVYRRCTGLWNVSTRELITNFTGHTDATFRAAFSPDGQTLATGSDDRTVKLWDVASFRLVGTLTNRFEVGSIAFSPDSNILAAAGLTFNALRETNRLAFWDLATKTELPLLPKAGGLASTVAFAENGRLVATGHFDGWVRLWDLKTGQRVAEFHKHSGMVWSLAFSRNSDLLASGGNDAGVVLYDVIARRPFSPLIGHTYRVWSVAFAPDGRTLVSASEDGTMRFWNLATRESALTLKQRLGPVASAAFTRDGNLLASCGADGDIWLWPAVLPKEIGK